MSKAELEEVWKQIEALPVEQKRQLLERLDKALGQVPTEEEFEQHLFEQGIISEIKPPVTDYTPYENRKPVEVKGRPISEIIIEERR